MATANLTGRECKRVESGWEWWLLEGIAVGDDRSEGRKHRYTKRKGTDLVFIGEMVKGSVVHCYSLL